MATQPKVAISKDFMEAYAALPRGIQRKVRSFTEKFQQDPTQAGINFERVNGAIDPKVRSVRIDQAYRAIIVHPPLGDVFMCVWVDHHDDAYDWVRNRRFEVNPRSGTLQLFQVEDAVAPAPVGTTSVAAASVVSVEPTSDAVETPDLLAAFDDEDLLLAGVPLPLLPAIRALSNERQLDQLAPHLPADAAEILYMLASGYGLLDAIEEAALESAPSRVDPDDFATALERAASQQTFKILEDEDELQRILDAPLAQWRIFLHPSQRRYVDVNAKGPVRLLGGAGTGKTVVLMHRANELGAHRFTADTDRILITTYTRNLAFDLEHNLKALCASDVYDRMEVKHLHRWAQNFMKRQGQNFRVLQNDAKRTEVFEQAILDAPSDEFPVEFYRDEWDGVVQDQGIASLDEYLTARRVGRGVRLRKKQRVDVWQVLKRYRELLDDQGRVEWPDVIRETRLFIEKQGLSLPYRAVLVDEVQDFTAPELRLLRTIAPEGPDCLYLVGDGHQRIYGRPVVMGHCGIEIRGRSRRLRLNYRTTQQIRATAIGILDGQAIDDLDGGTDHLKGYHSLREGPAPEVSNFSSEAKEASQIRAQLEEWLDAGVPASSICVAARTNKLLATRYEPMLREGGFEVERLSDDDGTSPAGPGIRLTTMHRMKGLEFSRVLLASVHRGVMPFELAQGHSDDVAAAEYELKERCLLYVSCTRARDQLIVVGFGGASPFLEGVG
jgi:hypothetical protein